MVTYPFGENFEELIATLDLVDIKPKKQVYNWTNRRFGLCHIAFCLDQFLVSSSLFKVETLTQSRIRPYPSSDHRPVHLHFEKIKNQGPIPFRFNLLWINKEEVYQIIEET